MFVRLRRVPHAGSVRLGSNQVGVARITDNSNDVISRRNLRFPRVFWLEQEVQPIGLSLLSLPRIPPANGR